MADINADIEKLLYCDKLQNVLLKSKFNLSKDDIDYICSLVASAASDKNLKNYVYGRLFSKYKQKGRVYYYAIKHLL